MHSTDPLPSGKPWYWLHLDERPEGVYVVGSNIPAGRIADLDRRGFDAAAIRVIYPEIRTRGIEACRAWKVDEVAKSREVIEPTEAVS